MWVFGYYKFLQSGSGPVDAATHFLHSGYDLAYKTLNVDQWMQLCIQDPECGTLLWMRVYGCGLLHSTLRMRPCRQYHECGGCEYGPLHPTLRMRPCVLDPRCGPVDLAFCFLLSKSVCILCTLDTGLYMLPSACYTPIVGPAYQTLDAGL